MNRREFDGLYVSENLVSGENCCNIIVSLLGALAVYCFHAGRLSVHINFKSMLSDALGKSCCKWFIIILREVCGSSSGSGRLPYIDSGVA